VCDHDGRNDDKGDVVLGCEDRDTAQKGEVGKYVGVGPAGHKERRGDGIYTLPSNLGALHMISETTIHMALL
jgi:hypothetical protein